MKKIWIGCIALALVGITGCNKKKPSATDKGMTECAPLQLGVHVSDVSDTSATLWAGFEGGEGAFRVTSNSKGILTPYLAPDHQTLGIRVTGLSPEESYNFELDRKSCAISQIMKGNGKFQTLPAPDARVAYRFLWGSSFGGKGQCSALNENDAPIFHAMEREKSPMTLFLGDLVDLNESCRDKSSAKSEEDADFYYRSQLTTPSLRKLMDQGVFLATLGTQDQNGSTGHQAFRRAFPFGEKPDAPFYRHYSFGQLAEIWLLDAARWDSTQSDWLINQLKASKATWKILATNLSLSQEAKGPEWKPLLDYLKSNAKKDFFVLFSGKQGKTAQFRAVKNSQGQEIFYELSSGSLLGANASSKGRESGGLPFDVKFESRTSGVSSFGSFAITGAHVEVKWIDQYGNILHTHAFKPVQ